MPPHQDLIKQIVDEVQTLPEDLAREVLDFIAHLRAKTAQDEPEHAGDSPPATVTSGKELRENKVLFDIKPQSEEHPLSAEQSGIEFLLSIAGMFDSGQTDTSENVETIVTNSILKKHGKLQYGPSD
jgi:hypothetical protein